MSRVAKNPVPVANGVQVAISGQNLSLKGSKGALEHMVHDLVKVVHEEGALRAIPQDDSAAADSLAGTTRALISNMVKGVTEGFERKLELLGVGYRAQVQGTKLNLTLGFSHPVAYDIPKGVTIETPSQTEVIVKGADKQQVGQVSAEIRAYRPPEPYKGKGVRYAGERIILKETKKK
jgi:large subunit ribosomal protein L6